MDNEDSRVEQPAGATPAARRALGRLPEEVTKTVPPPAPKSDGGRRRSLPPAAVGLRAATRPRLGASEKLDAAHSQVREKLESIKEEHKQRVWDKLDAAKKQADERLGRLQPFQPPRGGRGG